MQITIRRIADGQEIACPARLTGAALLRIFGAERLVLVSLTPLNNGTILRRFRGVSGDGVLYDLRGYAEVYDAKAREFLGIIDIDA